MRGELEARTHLQPVSSLSTGFTRLPLPSKNNTSSTQLPGASLCSAASAQLPPNQTCIQFFFADCLLRPLLLHTPTTTTPTTSTYLHLLDLSLFLSGSAALYSTLQFFCLFSLTLWLPTPFSALRVLGPARSLLQPATRPSNLVCLPTRPLPSIFSSITEIIAHLHLARRPLEHLDITAILKNSVPA